MRFSSALPALILKNRKCDDCEDDASDTEREPREREQAETEWEIGSESEWEPKAGETKAESQEHLDEAEEERLFEEKLQVVASESLTHCSMSV